jgi:NADH-quinone oxidoreductase subunit A
LLADYGYIGLLLALAILFAITTVLLPFSLSLPSRLNIYFHRFKHYLETRYPFMVKFMPPLPKFPKFMQVIPYKPNEVKNSTFECGMKTVGQAWGRFNFRYYYYALVFIALDVMVVFIYPWAVGLKGLGASGFIAILVLIFILFIGYLYAWKKKVLEWK